MEYFFDAASFTQLHPIEGELVRNSKVGEKIVDNHKVVSKFQQEFHEIEGGWDRLIFQGD